MNKNTNLKSRRRFSLCQKRQKGQSIVEYTAISIGLFFVVTAGTDEILNLTNAVRSNYDAFSYAVSLSDYPDKENYIELIAMYNNQGMPSDQREYLTDNPNAMVNDIKDFLIDSILPPEVTNGPDIVDAIGLGLEAFCDICDGNPFDDI